MKPFNKRDPGRRPPAPAATPTATPVSEAAELPSKSLQLRAVVFAVERVECPTCEGVVPAQNITSEIGEHPDVHAKRRTVTIDCPHCGVVHDAKFLILNGTMSVESCVPRGLKRSA